MDKQDSQDKSAGQRAFMIILYILYIHVNFLAYGFLHHR